MTVAQAHNVAHLHMHSTCIFQFYPSPITMYMITPTARCFWYPASMFRTISQTLRVVGT